jgi:preprotein translocase subunit SecG
MNTSVSERHVNQVILVVHLLVALAIIGLILLQRGKGADMGASFGGGASQTVFGSSGGGNVLTSATAWLSALFFATSFGLAMLADQQFADNDDLGFDVPLKSVETAPMAPAGDLPLADEPTETSDLNDLPID